MLAEDVVQPIEHGAALAQQPRAELGGEERRCDAVLVAHQVAGAVAERLLVAEEEALSSGRGSDHPLEAGERLGVSHARRCREAREEPRGHRSEEHTSELQSLMRNSYAVFCLKKKKITTQRTT